MRSFFSSIQPAHSLSLDSLTITVAWSILLCRRSIWSFRLAICPRLRSSASWVFWSHCAWRSSLWARLASQNDSLAVRNSSHRASFLALPA